MAVAYFKGHLASLTSNVGAVEQNVQTSVGGRLHGSPDHLLVLYARLAMTAAVWGLAFLGAIRAYRHHRFSFTYALLACSPFALMALQPYGGEILLRTYLFSLPFIALFAALLFYAGRAAASRSWITTALVGVATSTLMVGFLVTRYGNERMDYFTPQELSAVRYATKTARPGSVLLATTSSLPWKLERYEQFHYKVLSDSPGWSRIDPVRPDVNALVREVEVTLRHPAQACCVPRLPGRGSRGARRLNSRWRAGHPDSWRSSSSLLRALRTSASPTQTATRPCSLRKPPQRRAGGWRNEPADAPTLADGLLGLDTRRRVRRARRLQPGQPIVPSS